MSKRSYVIDRQLLQLIVSADAGVASMHKALAAQGFALRSATASLPGRGGVTLREVWRKRTSGITAVFTSTFRFDESKARRIVR